MINHHNIAYILAGRHAKSHYEEPTEFDFDIVFLYPPEILELNHKGPFREEAMTKKQWLEQKNRKAEEAKRVRDKYREDRAELEKFNYSTSVYVRQMCNGKKFRNIPSEATCNKEPEPSTSKQGIQSTANKILAALKTKPLIPPPHKPSEDASTCSIHKLLTEDLYLSDDDDDDETPVQDEIILDAAEEDDYMKTLETIPVTYIKKNREETPMEATATYHQYLEDPSNFIILSEWP